jgi:hypothetical protein
MAVFGGMRAKTRDSPALAFARCAFVEATCPLTSTQQPRQPTYLPGLRARLFFPRNSQNPFRFTDEVAGKETGLQFGLIAEEVAISYRA